MRSLESAMAGLADKLMINAVVKAVANGIHAAHAIHTLPLELSRPQNVMRSPLPDIDFYLEVQAVIDQARTDATDAE